MRSRTELVDDIVYVLRPVVEREVDRRDEVEAIGPGDAPVAAEPGPKP